MRTWWIIAFIPLAFLRCDEVEVVECAELDSAYVLELPPHFPSIDFPDDNELTVKRIELGRRLFYDTRLSADNSISCGSCHLSELGFTDGLTVAEGIEGREGPRNSPTLGNVAYQDRLFAEGGVPNLEIQILAPIGNENEFDHDVNVIEADLQADTELNDLSLLAYDREIDIYVVTRAISCFERTMITGNSRYDQYLNGAADFSEDESAGMDLFFSSELNCGTCHSGHNFTDGDFHNIGLYEEYLDEGRFRITNEETDKGKFKTPSLRNIEITNPYMHNGSIETLEEVLDHLNEGGVGHINQSELIVPLELSDEEKQQILAFLKTLTDDDFISNPDLKPLN